MHLEGFLVIGMLCLLLGWQHGGDGGVFYAVKVKGRKRMGILLGYLSLLFWTLFCGMPGLEQAREKSQTHGRRSNRKQIYHVLECYAEENAGAYLPDLRTFFETDDLTLESLFRYPRRHRPNPEFPDKQYLGSGHRIGGSTFPILRDLGENHPEKHCNFLHSKGYYSITEE